MTELNLNVGLLGHVDSGKTSIAKCLSVNSSTACFDKSPQSQERGITIDLGFSSFLTDMPQRLIPLGAGDSFPSRIQFTLVDCPGHASLIKTIIGGAQIIDIMLLVIDVTKGIQTQTAECLVIGEITRKPIVVALNKIDLVPPDKRDTTVEKVKKKMAVTLSNIGFKDVPMVSISANPGGQDERKEPPIGINDLIKCLQEMAFVPVRNLDKPMVLSVDHCFSIKGKGTVLTGTILQGIIRINDSIEVPSLQVNKKVKSIQIYKKNVDEAVQGDRVGVCVTQFDPKLLERGMACCPGYLSTIFAAIIKLTKVKYYKLGVGSKAKYHITLGYDTVLSRLTLFKAGKEFSFDEEYEYLDNLEEEEGETCFALLEFERGVIADKLALVIGSKLDLDVHTANCRIAFHGRLLEGISDKNYATSILPKLKVFKRKTKMGNVQRIPNDHELIADSIFKKETKMMMFTNLKVQLSTGESGIIEGSFGQSGKVKVRVPDGIKPQTMVLLTNKKFKQPNSDGVKIILSFKKYIFDKEKRIVQQ